MPKNPPEWFELAEAATPETMSRVAEACQANGMGLQVKLAPSLAHWFMADSLLLANRANREGMHANALALTRQCIEALGVIELGICGHADAEQVLLQWDRDKISPGKLRAWLETNVWPKYGNGLWQEPWGVFMREFSAAIQPYAHYTQHLAQWQLRLHHMTEGADGENATFGYVEFRPRAYDPQKATRITLYHALLTYLLGRVWLAANSGDGAFAGLIDRLGAALGKSRYLDGHATDWSQQFWAMLWDKSGSPTLE